MTYSELDSLISTEVGNTGIAFLHSESDHVNAYRGEFPLAVLDPPTAFFNEGGWPFAAIYNVQMVFMSTFNQDADWTTKKNKVIGMDAKAREFIQRIYQNDDHTDVTNVEIVPFFTFTFSSHLTAGVAIRFRIETLDSFDYCEIV